VWFGNVERVASERIGRETVTYVSNIYKYYITYRLLSEQRDRRNAVKAEVKRQLREVVDRECVGSSQCASARASGINFQACSFIRLRSGPGLTPGA
jgi:hypothetical protein